MLSWLFVAALAAVPQAAVPANSAGDPPQRVRNVQLYGEEACPKASSPDEIVVCARESEDERFRIPKQFRAPPVEDAAARSWATKAETVMEVNRAGLPDSCSPIGSGGQTGCTRLQLDQWRAERRARAAAEAAIP